MKKILALLFGLLVAPSVFAQTPLDAKEFKACMQGYDETDRQDRELSKESSALGDEVQSLIKASADLKRRKAAADATGNAAEKTAVTRETERLELRKKQYNAKVEPLDKRTQDLRTKQRELWKRCGERVPADGLLAQHCQGGKAQQSFCVMATEATFHACTREYQPIDAAQYRLREERGELRALVSSHNKVGDELAERRKRLERASTDAELDAYNRAADLHNERAGQVRARQAAYIADTKRMEERLAAFKKRCSGVHPSRDVLQGACRKNANAGFCAWYQGAGVAQAGRGSASGGGSDIDWMFEDD